MSESQIFTPVTYLHATGWRRAVPVAVTPSRAIVGELRWPRSRVKRYGLPKFGATACQSTFHRHIFALRRTQSLRTQSPASSRGISLRTRLRLGHMADSLRSGGNHDPPAQVYRRHRLRHTTVSPSASFLESIVFSSLTGKKPFFDVIVRTVGRVGQFVPTLLDSPMYQGQRRLWAEPSDIQSAVNTSQQAQPPHEYLRLCEMCNSHS